MTRDSWLALCLQVSAGFVPGGKKERMFDTGVTMAKFLVDNGLAWDGCHILDLGCGNGRLAMGFTEIVPGINYHGVEIIRECIKFCNMAFEAHNNFHFYHLQVVNSAFLV